VQYNVGDGPCLEAARTQLVIAARYALEGATRLAAARTNGQQLETAPASRAPIEPGRGRAHGSAEHRGGSGVRTAGGRVDSTQRQTPSSRRGDAGRAAHPVTGGHTSSMAEPVLGADLVIRSVRATGDRLPPAPPGRQHDCALNLPTDNSSVTTGFEEGRDTGRTETDLRPPRRDHDVVRACARS